MAHYQKDQTVRYTMPNGETQQATVFKHSGTVVAIELDTGERVIAHQNKLEAQ